jgi:hypothetical protein
MEFNLARRQNGAVELEYLFSSQQLGLAELPH